MAGHYTVQEAADATDLAVSTLRRYACGQADLVRGVDFYIHRFARFRRKLYFTPRGIQRLKLRAYHIVRKSYPNDARFSFTLPPRYDGTSYEEAVSRVANTTALVIREYRNHPCAVPNCPCMVHRLGLPQADEIAVMLQRVKDAAASRR
jgi:hypothetical protein